ncbi:MAG: hypothetical protein CUN57_01930, partial [Phototrophicales bacterium]
MIVKLRQKNTPTDVGVFFLGVVLLAQSNSTNWTTIFVSQQFTGLVNIFTISHVWMCAHHAGHDEDGVRQLFWQAEHIAVF